jgi:hypothetical protein
MTKNHSDQEAAARANPKRPAYDNPKTGPLTKDRQMPANLDGPLGPKQKEKPPRDEN